MPDEIEQRTDIYTGEPVAVYGGTIAIAVFDHAAQALEVFGGSRPAMVPVVVKDGITHGRVVFHGEVSSLAV